MAMTAAGLSAYTPGMVPSLGAASTASRILTNNTLGANMGSLPSNTSAIAGMGGNTIGIKSWGGVGQQRLNFSGGNTNQNGIRQGLREMISSTNRFYGGL